MAITQGPIVADRANEPPSMVEWLLSGLLRAGVVISLGVVIAGLALMFAHHPSYLASRSDLTLLTSPGAASPTTLAQVVTGVMELHGQAVVAAGLLLLIATPVLRVAVSIIAFIIEKDWRFTAITAVVLALLILSFVLGKVE